MQALAANQKRLGPALAGVAEGRRGRHHGDECAAAQPPDAQYEAQSLRRLKDVFTRHDLARSRSIRLLSKNKLIISTLAVATSRRTNQVKLSNILRGIFGALVRRSRWRKTCDAREQGGQLAASAPKPNRNCALVVKRG
jgi:hypothetical protein